MNRPVLAALSLLTLLSACVAPSASRPMPGSLRRGDDLADESLQLRERARAHFEEQKRRVERVGQRLLDTIPSHPKVQFAIVGGDPSINAGASFGQVAVTSGMLNFVKDDDELAIILGHELAHITEGHVMKGMMSGLALNVLAIVLETQAPGAGQAAGGIGQLFLNHYTQTQERVADEVGLGYAYAAGYDPRVAVDIQERLAVEVPQSMSAGYFDTHLSSVERAVAARQGSQQLLAQGAPPGRAEVLALERADERSFRRRPVSESTVASADAEPSDRRTSAAARDRSFRGEPEESAPSSGSEDCRRASVYSGMARDARALAEKQDLYRRALRYCPTLSEAHAGLARVLGDQGDRDGAERELRRARELERRDREASDQR